MEEDDLNARLSRMSTVWTVVFQAHQGDESKVTAAQQVLLQRYCGAVYRYLLGAVRDSHIAEELCQEFALGFVRGDFKHVHPQRGRFRDYLRTALIHLVSRYHKRRVQQPQELHSAVAEPAAQFTDTDNALDQVFLDGWREELLARSWEALAAIQEQTGQLFHTFLHHRVQHPDTSSAQMAEQLSKTLGRPLTAGGVRQTLHRAREKFAEVLLDEVMRSLETTDLERVEQELLDLGLFAYCQDALRQRKESGK